MPGDMRDEDDRKTMAQLIEELAGQRRRVAELESSEVKMNSTNLVFQTEDRTNAHPVRDTVCFQTDMPKKRIAWIFLALLFLASEVCVAAAIKVNFTLNTSDAYGAPLVESRYYYVYRPDGLSRNTPAPMILVMEAAPNSGAASMLNAKAAQAGFVVVSCSFSGNSTGIPGTVWNNDNPHITGFEDFDYTTEVIKRVRASDNCNDAFIAGISKGGHMAFAYACECPSMIKAAGPLDEFMGLTSNLPSAPVPMIVFQGTADTNVPYAMVKDAVDAWLATDGLLNATPITTYEASLLIPGKVTQITWRGGLDGTQVAFVTIIGGTHTYPTPTVQTGYDMATGLWAFFSQYLTSTQAPPKIVSQPVNNVQPAGQPASFWVAATGAAPLAYQWQKNGVDIPNATSLWYTTPPTTLADHGAVFRAMVTNSSGSVASSVATLTVNASASDPVITSQPTNQNVTAGQPASFSVTASGTAPLRYQWMKNGVNIARESSSTLTLPSALTSDCGATFRVAVLNSAGSVTSVAATLTVKPAPGAPIIIVNPERSRVLTNQTGLFSVTARSPSPMGYQWQKGTFVDADNFVNIAGANASTYTTPLTILADHLTLFRCVVTNSSGSTTSASEMLFVTTEVVSPKQITSDIRVSGQTGVPFSYTIKSSGGTAPIVFSASPLPSGLALDSGTGVISGTPAVADISSILLTATNSAGSVSATLTLTVSATPPVPPSFSISLDLDTSVGDQAIRSLSGIEPDSIISIQIFGYRMKNAVGFGARFEYNPSQVTYEAFEAGDVLPNTRSSGVEQGTDPAYVDVTAATSDSTAISDVGFLGTIRFRATSSFKGTTIQLVRAEIRRGGQFEATDMNIAVELLSMPTPDFDGDGNVGFQDFLLFAERFGSNRGDQKYDTKFDLNQDESIDFSDFFLFAAAFGKPMNLTRRGPRA